LKPDRKRMKGFVLLSGCEFSGSRLMSSKTVKRGVFLVLAVALLKRVLSKVPANSEFADQMMRDLIVSEWETGLVSLPLDAKSAAVSCRPVSKLYAFVETLLEPIALALDESSDAIGMVRALLALVGFRPEDSLKSFQLFSLAGDLRLHRERSFSQNDLAAQTLWLATDFPEFNESRTLIDLYLLQLFKLCSEITP
jgi:hypothetical protein